MVTAIELSERLDFVENLARMALSRTGQTTPVLGTPNTQSTAEPAGFLGYLRTVAAGVGVLNTAQAPAPGHDMRVSIDWSVRDIATQDSAYGSIQALVKNVGGVLTTLVTPRTIGNDAALALAAATLISPGASIEIQASPPAGYGGTLDWKFDITMTPN
jgi:hypothetical protein